VPGRQARAGTPVSVAAAVFRSSFPILYVDDLHESLRFYRDLLGFEELYRFPAADEPGFASLRLDDGKLGLSRADFPGIHGKPQRPVTGRPFELCLEAADVDAAVARLRAAGVEVLAEPADQVWGERVAYVADPDGNPVHIRGPIAGIG
jgi:lactoylglutathione lyase